MPVRELTADFLVAYARAEAMRRLEHGVRASAIWMCNVLKTVTARPTHGADLHGPAPDGVFRWHPDARFNRADDPRGMYGPGSPLGPIRRRANAQGGYDYRTGEPPYMRTGAGMRSICWEILEKNYVEGSITVRIGVDASARDAAHPYMLFHEKGISYPTRGLNKGSGPKLIRPWLKLTILRHWNEMTFWVVAVSRGWA